MATKILIPTALQPFTGDQDTVEVAGSTVGELLGALTRRHAELRRHLYDDAGRLRTFVNIYVNDRDVRTLDRDGTRVTDGDIVSIVPSIAGG